MGNQSAKVQPLSYEKETKIIHVISQYDKVNETQQTEVKNNLDIFKKSSSSDLLTTNIVKVGETKIKQISSIN
jgi:hypothetical protein